MKNHWCSILVSKTNKQKMERGTWDSIWACFLSSHIKPEAFTILKTTKLETADETLLCTGSAQVGLFWLGTRVPSVTIIWFCHYCWRRSMFVPILDGMAWLQVSSSRLLSRSLFRRAPCYIITSHGWRYRLCLKGSRIFYVMDRF